MSRAQNPHSRSSFHFGRTFRSMLPKGSSLPSELVTLLNDFEETLARRITQIVPAGEEVLHLRWIARAIEQLSAIQTDLKNISTALGLPTYNWKDKWIEMYYEDTAKLLDVSNSFISQIHMMEQNHRYLVCVLQHLSKGNPQGFCSARSSLDQWMELISLKDPSSAQCCSELDGFLHTSNIPKASDKEKVMVRAFYGFKVVTLLVFRAFAAIFSGSGENLTDIKVANVYLWAGAFTNLQTAVNTEVRNNWLAGKAIVLKEVKAINDGVNNVYPVLRDGKGCSENVGLANETSDLKKLVDEFSEGLELLLKEMNGFFKMLMSRRNALTGRLREAFDLEKVDKDKRE